MWLLLLVLETKTPLLNNGRSSRYFTELIIVVVVVFFLLRLDAILEFVSDIFDCFDNFECFDTKVDVFLTLFRLKPFMLLWKAGFTDRHLKY